MTRDRSPALITLRGEVDVAQARELAPVLNDLVGAGRDVVVDASLVTFIDSTALAALAKASGRLRRQGASLTIVCGPDHAVTQTIALAGLRDALRIAPTQAAAAATAG